MSVPKHKIITRAGGASFVGIHPTQSSGKKMNGSDLPPWAGNDGLESNFVRCKQCGFPFDRTKHPHGDGWGGNERKDDITGSDVKDPVTTGGCPFCGSSEYE